MSWQAAVIAGLALALLAGFAWYERSRPPARVLALVAALAALAVAGRLVLAPVPNVVATTDVAMLTGYALGGPPGFAVGALAAPISNIWLGQGPWTAWQMAGWGMAGLAGAGLAALSGRRLGRIGLGLACAAAGLAYGLLLDLSVMVSYGGEQSLDRYLALSARGLPFNIAHAAGNFALAFAAGPALVRMISRYRTRLEFRWRPAGALPLALAALMVATATGGGAGAAASSGDEAVSWLRSQQASGGGFGASPGYPPSPAMTGWAMLGLEAAGRNPLDVRRGGASAVSYLRANAGRLGGIGDLERTILALEGAGVDSRDFAGRDLVAELRSRRRGDGSVRENVNWTAFYLLAMRAADVPAADLRRSARWLGRAQNDDGGWGFRPGAPSDPDSTGAALQGLAATGAGGAVDRGVSWLRRAQTRSGGYALATNGVVNAQSTAWAAQGLVAGGEDGRTLRRALGYLGSLQAADGHYRYSRASDQTPVWVTAQAILAVERQALPIPAVARDRGAARSGGSESAGAAAGSSSPGDPGMDGAVGQASSGRGETPDRDEAVRGSKSQKPGTAERGSARAEDRRPAGTPSGALTTATALRNDTDAGESEDDGATAPYVAGGLGALAAALAGGFWWYRRRLP